MHYGFTIRQVLKNVASPVLDFCGVYDAVLSRRVYSQPTWLILMYHRVTESSQDDPFQLGMCVDRHHFEKQIEFHVTHFTPIGMSEAVARINAGKPLPGNAVSVTFDDGYLDFKDAALPVLKKYDCPSTIFVTTGGIEEREAFWWDRVTDAVARTNRRSVDIRFLAPGAPITELSLAAHKRRTTLMLLHNLLWEQPPRDLEKSVESLVRQLGIEDGGPLAAPRMRHADIAAIAAEGVELGAHCEQHVDMRRLTETECVHELKASREQLREITGQSINGFAYPGGRENTPVQKLVARAGFSYAAGTLRGVNRQPYDMYSLRRVGAPDTGVSDYKRCLGAAAGVSVQPLQYESIPWP